MAVIAYDTVFELPADCVEHDVALSAESTSGDYSPITVRLSTDSFRLEVRDGRLRVDLHRSMSNQDAILLGKALVAAGEKNIAAHEAWLSQAQRNT